MSKWEKYKKANPEEEKKGDKWSSYVKKKDSSEPLESPSQQPTSQSPTTPPKPKYVWGDEPEQVELQKPTSGQVVYEPEIREQRFREKAEKIKEIREKPMVLPDGTESTVKLQSSVIDGKNVVYPTLFPKSKDGYSSSPSDWVELDGVAAYDEAKKRGEIIEFDTQQEADEFAKGSWKTDDYYKPEGSIHKVNDKVISRKEIRDNLFNRDFIEGVRSGEIKVQIENDPNLSDLLKKQVESGSEWGDKLEYLESGLYRLLSGAAGGKAYLADLIEEVTGLPATDNNMDVAISRLASQKLAEKSKNAIKNTRQYKEGFYNSIVNGNILDAINIGSNSTMESASLMVASALTGGVGTGSAVLSGLLIPSEYAFQDVSDDEKIKDLSRGKKLVRAFLYGTAEGVGESISGGIASNSFNIFKSGLKGYVKKAAEIGGNDIAKEVAEGMAKKTAMDIAKAYGIDIAKEGSSEMITQLSQDLTDELLGVHELSLGEYLENMREAGAIGAFMGGGLSSPSVVGNTLKVLRDNRKVSEIESKIDAAKESGEITEDEANTLKDNLRLKKEAVDKTDPEMSEENQVKVANLVKEKTELEESIKNLDENQPTVIAKKERVEKINEEISSIKDKKTKEDAFQGPIAEEVDVRQQARDGKTVVEEDQEQTPSEKIEEEQEIKEGDTVKATVDTYKNGKRVQTTQQAEVVSVNEDGTFNLKKGKLTFKNVAPIKIRKYTPSKSIESETEGLTQKEITKQGVTELVDGIKRKSREKLNSVVSSFKEKIAENKTKLKDFKDRKDFAVSFVNNLLSDLDKSGVKYLPTKRVRGILSRLKSVKTDKSLETALTDALETLESIAVTDEEIKTAKRRSGLSEQANENAKLGKFGDNIKATIIARLKEIPSSLMSEYDSVISNLGQRKSSIDIDHKAVDDFIDKYSEYLSERTVDEPDAPIEIKDKGISDSELAKREVQANETKSLFNEVNESKLEDLNPYFAELVKKVANIPLDFIKKFDSNTISQLNDGISNALNGTMSGTVVQRIYSKYQGYLDAQDILNAESVLKKASDEISAAETKKRKKLTKEFFAKKLSNLYAVYFDSVVKAVEATPIYTLINRYMAKKSLAESEIKDENSEFFKLFDKAIKSKRGSHDIREFDLDKTIFMLTSQLQHETNPNSKKTPSVEQFIEKLKEDREGEASSRLTDKEFERIIELYESFKDKDGKVTSSSIRGKLTKAEIRLVDKMLDTTSKRRDRGEFINTAYRNNPLSYINNYMPRRSETTDTQINEDDIWNKMTGRATSMKGHSSYDRVSGVPVSDFSSISPYMSYIRESSLDFHLTPEIKIIESALSDVNKNGDRVAKNFSNALKENLKKNIQIAFNSAYNYDSSSLIGKIVKQSVRNIAKSILITPIRLFSEFVTNSGVVASFKAGIGATAIKSGDNINDAIKTITGIEGSTQINKLGGNKADISSQDSLGLKFGRISGISELAHKKVDAFFRKNFLIKFGNYSADIFYRSADVSARPIWYGKFLTEFNKVSGEKFNLEKLKSDPDYRIKHERAIRKSVAEADRLAGTLFNTGQLSEAKLKQQLRRGTWEEYVKDFMQSFAYNEAPALRNSFKSLVGKGIMTKAEAATTLMAITTRAIVYQVMNAMIMSMLISMIYGDDILDEDELEKEIERSLTSFLILSAMGNKHALYKMAAGVAVNFAHKMYQEKVKKEDYNQYEDAIAFAPDMSKGISGDVITKSLGGSGVYINDVNNAIKTTNKILDKIEKDGWNSLSDKEVVELRVLERFWDLASGTLGLPMRKEAKLLQRVLEKHYGVKRKWENRGSGKKNEPKTKGTKWVVNN